MRKIPISNAFFPKPFHGNFIHCSMYSENEITALIIKEAIYVHQSLGPGLLESVYQNCLLHRLSQTGLQIERECPVPVIFESIKLECG